MTKLTKNFNLEEFACHNGNQVPKAYLNNVKKLAGQLQILRDHVNKPVHINSGYRTPTYNKGIGGASGSQHLIAKAADVTVEGYTPRELATLVEKLINEKEVWFGGIGVYPTFVHLDVRDKHARW